MTMEKSKQSRLLGRAIEAYQDNVQFIPVALTNPPMELTTSIS